MKKIGIIGGMSFESTAHYYEEINKRVNALAGGHCSADLMIRSVNFEKYYSMMMAQRWDKIGKEMEQIAYDLTCCGCEHVAIATNTMHKVADQLRGVPLIHIGDCVAEECLMAGAERVVLLGTKFTMTEDFMKDRLKKNGLEVVEAFSEQDIDRIDKIIFEELCHGRVENSSKNYLRDLMLNLCRAEVDGIILGCTELDMIIDDSLANYIKSNFACQVFDTTEAHVNKIVQLSIA